MSPARLPRRALPRETPVRILSISASAEDHSQLRRLLRRLHCKVATAGSCHTAIRRLRQGRTSIVVCERTLPDGTWRDILAHLGGRAEKPLLVVTSRLADEFLWAEVLNLGGFDVIAKPFDAKEVHHVLETACLRRHKAEDAGGKQAVGVFAA